MITPDKPSVFQAWRMTAPAKSLTNQDDIQRVLHLDKNNKKPTLQPGQVLVQVAVCTLNDEDGHHLKQEYINTKDISLPRAVGFEGSGLVVESKIPWYMPGPRVGTRVAFYAETGNAMAEYMVVDDPMTLVPIPDGVSYTTAAAAVTNHFTVKIMADRVKKQGHKAVINTVPAGALGRIFTKYASSKLGLTVIGTVRRDEQKELVLNDGAKYVLNLTDDDFEQQLAQVIEETGCRFAYDGLGGDMPNKLLTALPQGSTVSVYSHIVSTNMHNINVLNWFGKKLEAFNAGDEAKMLWTWQLLGVVSQLQEWMKQPEYATKIKKQYAFQDLAQAVYDSNTSSKTAGKVQVIVNSSMMEEA